jgi:uncharacterized protein
MDNHHNIVLKTKDFVQKTLTNAESGHDWWHAYRVWKLSILISKKEGFDGDILAVELASLLHDIADAKFNNGDETVGPKTAEKFMSSLKLATSTIDEVLFVIKHISYKGGEDFSIQKTEVLKIVQDADRIDALGAIGIARTFSYGGFKQRPMYDPDTPPIIGMTKEEYRKNDGPTINHFYEKLFLLKKLMNTKTGKDLAEKRHLFMEQYLNQFYCEWNGEI